MSFTYEWKVTSLKVKNEVNVNNEELPNAVVQTYWEVSGTNADGVTGTFSGATPFTAKKVPSGEFVAFEELTEETVLSWIQADVNNNPVYKKHIDEQIQRMIDDKNQVVREIPKAGLPWATPEDEVTPPTPDPIEVVEP